MKLTSLIVTELKQELELTRRALELLPDGKNDWKPHPKSMPFGQLAHMVATMPSWISMMVNQHELDVKPKRASGNGAVKNLNAAQLVKALEQSRGRSHPSSFQFHGQALGDVLEDAREWHYRDGEAPVPVHS